MTTVKVPKAENFVDRIAAALERHADPDETDSWRLVRAGERASIRGDHGSWVETDHPAVVACMGSVPQCAENGCQLRKLLAYCQHLPECEIAQGPSWVVQARPPEAEPDPGRDGVCTCGLAEILDPPQEPTS